MKRKVTALMTAATVALCLTACGGVPQAGDPSSTPSSSAVTPPPSSSEAASTVEPSDTATASTSLTTNGGAKITLSSLEYRTEETTAPVVYYIPDITPEAMMEVYAAMNWTPTGKVAVKLSTGEPPASNYLRPELIQNLVQSVDGTIVECNTAYGGSRASTAMHKQVAEDHGFTAIADVDIQDENGSMTLPVEGGTVLSENYVGASFGDYDSYLVLSHFKGHSMAGFGGAIKNISIGMGSSEGKAWIHSGGASAPVLGAAIRIRFWNPWETRENPYPMRWETGITSPMSA